jgi:hypothetical protein
MKLSILIFALLLLTGSCFMLKTHVHYPTMETNQLSDTSYQQFKQSVHAHYDSISKFKKITNDVFEDNFLESNIMCVNESIEELNYGTTVGLGYISGVAPREEIGWLIYRIKEKALLRGANILVNVDTIYTDNENSLGRLISKDTSAPVLKVKITANSFYVK